MRLSEAFGDAWKHDAAAVDAALERAVERAEAAWPALALDRRAFVAYLAARLTPGADPRVALESWHVEDLYLACACAQGSTPALAALEERYLAILRIRAGLAAGIEDELRQALRERLLVADAGGGVPRIAAYTGRGALAVWLRICATRVAIDLRRGEMRHGAADDDWLAGSGDLDPELRYLRARHSHELAAAFREAMDQLPARDINLLRMHFLDGLSAAELGRVHRVSSRTIQRWLSSAREAIRLGTRARLQERLGLDSRDIDSLLAPSRLDMSITGLLRGRVET